MSEFEVGDLVVLKSCESVAPKWWGKAATIKKVEVHLVGPHKYKNIELTVDCQGEELLVFPQEVY